MKHCRYLILLLFLLPHATLQAQQLTVSGGGEGTSTAGMVSQSVGQVFFQAVQHGHGMVSEGVQQAYVIEQMYLGDVAKEGPELSLYPNPSAGDVVLKTTGSVPEDAVCILLNLDGQVLFQDALHMPMMLLPVGGYAAGIYLLRVVSGGYVLGTFKIVKN